MRMKASHSTCSIQTCRNKELTSSKVIPGVVTPSEVELASRQPLRESERFDNWFVCFLCYRRGLTMLKFFPAEARTVLGKLSF